MVIQTLKIKMFYKNCVKNGFWTNLFPGVIIWKLRRRTSVDKTKHTFRTLRGIKSGCQSDMIEWWSKNQSAIKPGFPRLPADGDLSFSFVYKILYFISLTYTEKKFEKMSSFDYYEGSTEMNMDNQNTETDTENIQRPYPITFGNVGNSNIIIGNIYLNGGKKKRY